MVAIGPVKQVTHDRGPLLWAPEQRPLWGHGRSLRWGGILGLRKRQGHDWSLWELELCPLWGHGRSLGWGGMLGLRKWHGHDWSL